MGSVDAEASLASYSVPAETLKILSEGIFNNSKITRNLAKGTAGFVEKIKFTGSDSPTIPVPWRFAESSAALQALEACTIAELVRRKYGVEIESVTIDTDHASLYFISGMLWSMTGDNSISDPGIPALGIANQARINEMIPDYNYHFQKPSVYRDLVTNIYATKDNRWFHLHGSLNPDMSLQSIGLPSFPEDPELNTNRDKARDLLISKMKTIDSSEMQRLASEEYKQAGVIVNTVEQFRESEHGKANEHVGLFEIHDVDSGHKPSWWPECPQTSAARPLAGLKVVDLTRIIAAPAVTRALAELGASVMRVTSPTQPDFSFLHPDLNWGKWNCTLNLKEPGSVEKLRALILDADVVVQGYRPGALDKYGFGQGDIIDLVKGRDRGIISVRENCYGWQGPWSGRSGWQQISDACVGISHSFGRAMGLPNDEAVTPVFPNSDYQTGIAGVVGILTALMRRGEKGGSYKVDLALNYYNQWLADTVGEYPKEVWEAVWNKNGRRVFRSYDNMSVTVPEFVGMMKENSGETAFNKGFFEDRKSGALGESFYMVKPIIKFDQGEVKLGYNVGTRGNGKDAAYWPDDLMTEVVV